jgi:mono/diheme cytochrome c family protein
MMRRVKRLHRAAFSIVTAALAVSAGAASQPAVSIPDFWNEAALHDYELPLATPANSPQHVSRDYYYALPERVLYKSYPIYHPSREPAGYLDTLRALEPQRAFDAASLKTEADWIAAGRDVFEMPIGYNGPIVTMQMVRDPAWYDRHHVPLTKDGTMPFARYVVRAKGRVDVGNVSCAMCHTRVMPDGTALAGAQGNFPFDAVSSPTFDGAPPQALAYVFSALAATPWDAAAAKKLTAMTPAQIQAALTEVPAGVIVRQGTSLFAPPAIPDLIGIRDRKYLDKTGLGRHRGIADVMRYAALNQTLDLLGSYGGFVPGAMDGKTLPPPGKGQFVGTESRHSDAQLYALAQFIYSLTPPSNPNRFDERAQRGQEVFTASGCARCHTPPLYTANKLVPADGFTPPADHYKRYDILDARVGTDPVLTMTTRRGTGYYKIPSLKGVWYRGPLEHNGSVATLEDWFDPRRLRDDYVPTGWIGFGVKSRAVKGHPFGLSLSENDRAALIAFLKTL